MATEVTRNYNGSDASMLDASETMQAQFLLDLADFTAFDTTLDADFGNDWANANEAALVSDSDDLVLSQQLQLTTEVETAHKNCRNKYIDVIYFAEKAFKGNRDVLREFGQGEKYDRARRSQYKMVDFIEELARTATKYSAQLTANGCPPSLISSIAATGTILHEKNINQNLSVNARPVVSRERVTLLNTAYGFMAQVIEAAQRIYRDNSAKLGQYQYTPAMNSNESGSATFTLAPGEEKLIAEIPYNPTRQLNFGNTGNTTLQFGLNTTATMPATGLITLSAGNSAGTTMGNMAPAGTYLMVKNTGATGGSGEAEWEE